MLFPSRSSKAFTLLELIVVIVILGILAGIAIPTFQKIIAKSKDSAAVQTLQALDREAKALAAFENRSVTEEDYAEAASDLNAAALGVHAASFTTDRLLPAEGTRVGARVDGDLVGLSIVSASGSCVTLRSAAGAVTVFNHEEDLGANCTGAVAQQGAAAAGVGYSDGISSAPTAVSAVAGNASAKVSWSAPVSDGGSPIASYTVTSTPATVVKTWTTGPLSAEFTGLSNGTSYVFHVTASNASGVSAAASSEAVTPATLPAAPASVSALAGDASAKVSWTAPASDGGSPVTSYTVTSTPATQALTWTSGPLAVDFPGLVNGTSYVFNVTARTSVGAGPAASSSAVTPAAAPSAPGSVLVSSPSAGSLAVSWSAASPNGSAVTRYDVTALTSDGVSRGTCSTASLTCTVTGLANGVAYTARVTATNAVGTGPAASSAGSATPLSQALRFSSTISGCPGGVNCYVYEYLSTSTDPSYVIASGDRLEWWQFNETDAGALGLDVHTVEGPYLRDSGSSDQNGVSPHPGASIGAGKWVFRSVTLPSTMHGKTISHLNVVNEHDDARTHHAQFASVVIRSSSGAVTKSFWEPGAPVPSLPRHFASHTASSSLTLVQTGP